MNEFNAEKLHAELIEAGIIFDGCDSNGNVFDGSGNIIQSQAIQTVLLQHDPTPVEKKTLAELIDDIDKRLKKIEK